MAAELKIVLKLKDQASKAFKRVQGQITRFVTNGMRQLKKLTSLRSLLVGFGIFRIGKGFIDAAAKIEVFEKQLIAVTGSAKEANRVLNEIREFARTSPLETEDVVQSFVRLRAVGIDPTMKQMRTLGGVSVLFNREMTDVLNSFVGLNKRTLRQVGIEIDRTGAKAIIASGNIKKVVEKDTASIREALIEIWEKRFPNAIETAADTFTAQMAILRSNVFEFQAQLTSGFLPDIKKVVMGLTGLMEKTIENLPLIRTRILQVAAGIRTVFNILQIAVDTAITGIMNLGTMFGGFLTAAKASIKPIGDMFVGLGKIIIGVASNNVSMLLVGAKELKKGFEETGETAGAIMKRTFEDMEVVSGVNSKAMEKNLMDIARAWLQVEDSINAKPLKPKLTGSLGGGSLGADIGSGAGGKAAADKRLNDRLKLLDRFSKMRAQSETDQFVRARKLVDEEFRRTTNVINKAMGDRLITYQEAEGAFNSAAQIAANKRKAIAQDEADFNKQLGEEKRQRIATDASVTLSGMAQFTEAMVSMSKARKDRLKPYLVAAASMKAAAAIVDAIKANWAFAAQGGNPIAGAIMTAGAIASIAASTKAQISQIRSAATGADFTTSGPQLLRVGDNATGRERVTVTPIGTPNVNGPQINNSRNLSGATFQVIVNDQVTGQRMIEKLRSGDFDDFVVDMAERQKALS